MYLFFYFDVDMGTGRVGFVLKYLYSMKMLHEGCAGIYLIYIVVYLKHI